MIDPALFDRLPLIADGDPRPALPPEQGEPPFERLVLSHPEAVEAMHRAYAEAGARLIRTLTAHAGADTLEAHGLTDRAEAIHVSAHAIARNATLANATLRNASGMPPGGQPPGGTMAVMAPFRPPARGDAPQSAADWAALYGERVVYLSDAGVDFFLLEHFTAAHHTAGLVDTIKRLSDAPVLALLSGGADDPAFQGAALSEAARRLAGSGADALGLSCLAPHPSPDAPARALEALGEAVLPLAVMARGVPGESPEEFAARIGALHGHGALILGGCCDTTPLHIAALHRDLHGVPHGEAGA